jgi:hypothetical protein
VQKIFGIKNTIVVRQDLKEEGIRPHLWLFQDPHVHDRWLKPMAPYVLKEDELIVFMDCLKSLRVPTKYCSAPLKHVAKKKLLAMKAHDWHIFIQQLLPLCLRGLKDQWTRIAIMRLSHIFRRICVKVLDPADMGTLTKDATITMCMLEMTMPPSFFDTMVHLIFRLVDELDMCGHVHTRWMYCVERLNKVLKGYVQNMV